MREKKLSQKKKKGREEREEKKGKRRMNTSSSRYVSALHVCIPAERGEGEKRSQVEKGREKAHP